MTIQNKGKPSAGRILRLTIAAGLIAALQLDSLAAFAGVSSTTKTRYYNVSGTAKSTLARKMRANPFRGDNGGAIANIRPKYTLNLTTKKTESGCRIRRADLKVRFTLTLPRANQKAMSSHTRSSWRNFVSFARRHELRHRTIYLQCARKFVGKAQRISAKSCRAAKAQARHLLRTENRACDKRHRAFDRGQRRAVAGLSLFRGTRR